ncbi:MAG: hypothetical protein EOO92_27710 [Pedobacter sp.]|nr:MAG: hypothetical protein EOO92_27710 [Pedobacter sp.]
MEKLNNATPHELRVLVAKEAFNSRCMIWSVDDQKYYTPREFVESDVVVEVRFIDSRRYFSNITMFAPEYAIKQELERIKETQTKVDLFIQRVFTAFELQPIVKTQKKR